MVLVTSLVILMILTMLGLSSVQGTSIQELISRNQRDSNLAFNAVETALVEAEATLSGLSNASWQAIVGGDYASSTSPKIYNAKSLGSFFANAVDPDVASSAYCRQEFPAYILSIFQKYLRLFHEVKKAEDPQL